TEYREHPNFRGRRSQKRARPSGCAWFTTRRAPRWQSDELTAAEKQSSESNDTDSRRVEDQPGDTSRTRDRPGKSNRKLIGTRIQRDGLNHDVIDHVLKGGEHEARIGQVAHPDGCLLRSLRYRRYTAASECGRPLEQRLSVHVKCCPCCLRRRKHANPLTCDTENSSS